VTRPRIAHRTNLVIADSLQVGKNAEQSTEVDVDLFLRIASGMCVRAAACFCL
jgi:UDP-3-O-[3-hydroxymyristoyl] glucosamine N-acyltransferase